MPVLDWSTGLTGPRWMPMNDSIMGGCSSSDLSYDEDLQAVAFTGDVTTANNGGFASVRSEPWAGWAAPGAQGVSLSVKGDGRTYKLSAKMDDGYDGPTYQQDFCPPEGAWTQVYLKLENFSPTFRGRVLPGQPPLSGGKIRQMGIMVSKFSDGGGFVPGFKTGRFKLAVRTIKMV